MELKRILLTANLHMLSLLIVPYGIETLPGIIFFQKNVPFNRTLWN